MLGARARLIIMFALLSLLATFFQSNSIRASIWVKNFLESDFLTILLIYYAAISVAIHTLFVRIPSIQILVRNDILRLIFNFFLELGTYCALSSTGPNLLKSVYLQHFFNIQYFVKFDVLDLFAMVAASVVIIIYTIIETTNLLREAWYICRAEDVNTTSTKNRSETDTDPN